MAPRIHQAALVGFDVGADAYERGRPDYPAEAVDHLVQRLAIGPGRVILDLGAGTGKLTRLLSGAGARLLAAEPVEGMRRTFRDVLPDVPILGAQAEALPFREASLDAVVVAQAFHWFDAMVAVEELHRVIRPGGGLALVWNVRDETFSFWAALSKMLEPHQSDAPRHRWYAWRAAFEGGDLFSPLELRAFLYEQRLPREAVFDRVMSTSFLAALPEDDKREFTDQLRTLLDTDSGTTGHDEIALPYRTDVYTCTRLPDSQPS